MKRFFLIGLFARYSAPSSLGARLLTCLRATALASALLFAACESKAVDKAKLPERSPSQAEGASSAAASKPEASTSSSTAEPRPDTTNQGSSAVESKSSTDDSLPPFTGRSESHRRSILTPRMPGIILEMHVRDGDVVEKGQTLVTFDVSDYRLRVQAAEAAVSVANAQKKALKTEWQRLKDLSEKGAIPASQFEQLDGQLSVAIAGIAQADLGVKAARKALNEATSEAPYRGVVMAKMASEGEYAAAMPPTPLVRLEELDPLDVRIGIPEASMREAALGTCLEITFPAVDVMRNERITQVIPSVNPMTRTFSVVVSLANPDLKLQPGMFTKVRIIDTNSCPTVVEPETTKSTASEKGAKTP